ncbi:MAG: hypothetical protein R3362_04155, partial [Rhodothermales bacterium]|nr:hypothetical protein [Rhodothermales bacterium]
MRWIRWTFAFALLLLSADARAQLTPLAEGGARMLAMGRAGTAATDDVWGQHNPASWSTLAGPAVGLFATQLYGLPEM